MKRILTLLLAALLLLGLAACDSTDYEEVTFEDETDVSEPDAPEGADLYSTPEPTTAPAPVVTPTPTPDWRSAYADAVLHQGMLSNYIGAEIMGTYLFYLNDDDIPELYVSYAPMAAGSELYTYDGQTVDRAGLSGGMVSYSEHGNILLNRYIHTGSGWDAIYTIRNGRFVELTNGESELRLNSDDTFDYTWNGVSVSEAEYNANLNAIADVTGLWHIDENCFSDADLFARIGA